MNGIKSKMITTMGKVLDSKFYKFAEKTVLAGTSACVALTPVITDVLAADGEGQISVTVDTSSVLANANPFINPAVTVLCVVGGIRIGWGFLKRAFH